MLFPLTMTASPVEADDHVKLCVSIREALLQVIPHLAIYIFGTEENKKLLKQSRFLLVLRVGKARNQFRM